MSLITVQNRYHVALDGVGLILQGAPDRLAYQQQQAPIYGQRFASGDRDYTDFSFWWFWAQTDFSGGIKHEEIWEDDAKYFSSKGISPIELPGSVLNSYSLLNTGSVAKDMTYYDYGEVQTVGVLVGRNNTDQKMRIVKVTSGAGGTQYEATASGADEKIWACDSFGGDQKLYIGCNTIGDESSTFKILTAATPTDLGALTTPVLAVVCDLGTNCVFAFTTTAGVYKWDVSASTLTQVTTAYPMGISGTGFSFGHFGSLVGKGAVLVGDAIYFTGLNNDGATHLFAFDTSSGVITRAKTFDKGTILTTLIERGGSLYLFGQNSATGHVEIWKKTGDAISKIHEIGRVEQIYTLVANPIKTTDSIFFTLDDGLNSYQIWGLGNGDELWNGITPPSAYATDIDMLACLNDGYITVVKSGASGTNAFAYNDPGPTTDTRATTGNVVTSIFSGGIPAIDKLFNSVTINFKQMVSGDSITVEYALEGSSSFTTLGSASHAVDGGSIGSKVLYFGAAVVAKRIQLRFTLASGGNTSPSLDSFSTKFVPLVDQAKQWSLRINCANELLNLDGGRNEFSGRELRAKLETSWLTKSLVDFQDLDFSQTQINAGAGLSISDTTATVDSTAGFPESGRLRCENEEILYTGKTPTTFTGLIRGARGTAASAHADNTVISNGYRVIITDIGSQVPIMLRDKKLEYVVDISVREA